VKRKKRRNVGRKVIQPTKKCNKEENIKDE
jgi:hypothetical protein